jgi:hypothetical protein
MSNWIDVRDKIPNTGEVVLVCLKLGSDAPYVRHDACFCKHQWFYDRYNDRVDCVSHWMPLPKPPQEVCGENPELLERTCKIEN